MADSEEKKLTDLLKENKQILRKCQRDVDRELRMVQKGQLKTKAEIKKLAKQGHKVCYFMNLKCFLTYGFEGFSINSC